jgi:NTE family protein
MASTSVDAGAIIGGILLPGTISEKVAEAYNRVLFKDAVLADLPDDDAGPRFVINATNVQSATLWRFSKPYMGDYSVGLVRKPNVSLATAVAASSAFPPMLSPLKLDIRDAFDPQFDGDLKDDDFRRSVVLSDGGVYDNLGLETATKRYKTILVSDGGQKTSPEAVPAHDWARHSVRILEIVDNQVRSLRKRQLIEEFRNKAHNGTYWGIRSDFLDYHAPSDPLGCAGRDPRSIAETPTRLQAMPERLQEKLINWAYAITDTALRVHFAADLQAECGIAIPEPTSFPYAGGY